ncbi:MAG: TlpA disulfide reductase family protein [Ferruginibacter sp.]
MKYLGRILLLMVLHFQIGANVFSQGVFEINGSANRKFNGAIVKLLGKFNGRPYYTSITSEIINSKFFFSENIKNKFEFVYLEMYKDGKQVGDVSFFITNKKMGLKIEDVNMKDAICSINYTNVPFIDLQIKYQNFIKSAEDYRKKIGEYIYSAGTSFDEEKMKSLKLKLIEANRKVLSKKIEFILKNSDSYFSLYHFTNSILNTTQISADSLDKIYSKFDNKLKTTPEGKKTYDVLQRKVALDLNKFPPDFTFKSNLGDRYSLSQFKSKKYVLLCFWASWCGPCKRGIPILKKIDSLYKLKGLQLISVSIDDKKSNWIEAIKENQMPWIQTCDIDEYFIKQRVRDLYSIIYIPQYYLLDLNGQIIYQNVQSNDDDDYTVLLKILEKRLK